MDNPILLKSFDKKAGKAILLQTKNYRFLPDEKAYVWDDEDEFMVDIISKQIKIKKPEDKENVIYQNKPTIFLATDGEEYYWIWRESRGAVPLTEEEKEKFINVDKAESDNSGE